MNDGAQPQSPHDSFIDATLKAYGQELSADGQAGRFDDENTLLEAVSVYINSHTFPI